MLAKPWMTKHFQQGKAIQGYEPSLRVRIIRSIASSVITVLQLNGRTRWSNEFMQALNPSMTVPVPGFTESTGEMLWFRTGHGRLYWRVTESPGLEPVTNHWISRLSPRDVLFDVGANIGLYAMTAAKYRSVRVFAFEPDLMNARLLYENVLRNNLEKSVTVLPIALDSVSRLQDFHLKSLSYGDALHNLGNASRYVRNPSGFVATVAAFALDDLILNLKIPSPSHLKIDVDGNEIEVLRGAYKTLATVKEILVEVDLESANASKIDALLVSAGFLLHLQGEEVVAWNRCVERLYVRPKSGVAHPDNT